ncbi:M20 family metallopeptidase [Candidatus Poriferisodalis sp.]|uniref:M20 family metallopeptidase n=1 Tax=Candidatus Poriferisodalis sp. TaxID=3101277 RepID=UPI003B018079
MSESEAAAGTRGTATGATDATGQSIAELLSEIVRIPSVNPMHQGPRSGTAAEADMADWLAERATALGADVELEVIQPGRPNVYARFAGRTERMLAIDIHLDTVGVEHMEGEPFDGRVSEGRVWGRGAVDTKATMAVVLAVLGEMASAGQQPACTVELVGTISEEGGGLAGATAYRDRLLTRGERREQIVVAEPTMCAPVYGHKGGLGIEVQIEGRAAHSSKPHLGINALSAGGRVVAAIDAEQERLTSRGKAGALGAGTVSVNEMHGGRARNIVPDLCELYVGRRIADGEDYETEYSRLTEVIRAAALPARVSVQMANGFGSNAFLQAPECALVTSLAQLSGRSPEVADYGTNALRYGEVADQIAVFGPGSIDQAHQAVEWVEISQLERAADIYRKLLTR